MYSPDLESADCTSDDHHVTFKEYLSTIDFFVVCEVTGNTIGDTRQMGSWLSTDYMCLWCNEVFSIINPDPVNQDLS